MSITTYDGDLGVSLYAEFEIEYDYDSPQTDFMYGYAPGNITLHKVTVSYIEAYNWHGDIVYRKRRCEITPDWLPVLDGVAYNYVNDSIDSWDQLADHLVECA